MQNTNGQQLCELERKRNFKVLLKKEQLREEDLTSNIKKSK